MSTIYIHWPFCLSKCYYCDFNSMPCNGKIDFRKWFDAYLKVLLAFKDEFYKGEMITSVYFGGGTPSLLPSWFVSGNHFRLSDNAEITLEANPKTINKSKASELKKAGINRLSIGVQSIIDEDLKMLGRIHSAAEAKACVFEMSEIFENLSIDMIYNRPGQKLDSWRNELSEVLCYPINHISLYELIVEPGTKMESMINSGSLPKPNKSSKFFETTIETAKNHGFEMYEVSNFAKDKHYGKHNLSYWKYEDYYGIGPESHSRVSINGQKIAISQISDNSKWLDWAENPVFDEEKLSEEDVFKEKLIMGLRSKCGININDFSPIIQNKHHLQKKIRKLRENSYIMENMGHVFLTYDGIMRLNLIVQYLVED